MKGRKAVPTKILARRGSWRAKTRDHEILPPSLKPKAPEWLDVEGKKLWKCWWKRLEMLGLLTIADEITFARYCQSLARWIKMEQFIQKHGEVYPIKNTAGHVVSFAIFPQVGIYLRLSDQLLKMEAAFGLTPSSRVMMHRQETPPHGNAKPDDKKTKTAAPPARSTTRCRSTKSSRCWATRKAPTWQARKRR